MEERLRAQASRCYHKATRIPSRNKREKLLSGFSTVQIYEDDIVPRSLEMKELVTLAAIEVDESRYIFSNH